MITGDEEKIREILVEFGSYLSKIPVRATPPEIGREVYRIVSQKTGFEDPYREIKEENTRQALSLYPKLKKDIASSPDPLLAAVRMAIAGNIIDFGANAKFDMIKDLNKLLTQKLAIDFYEEFCETMRKSRRVLYLADNAGETVFDRLLIEELGKPVIYAVRQHPVINDAVRKDALDAGIGEVAEIVSSGTDAPGTILNLCSREFIALFDSADFIISKGQGNYEGLSEAKGRVFFLLQAKCPVIARDIGVEQGSILLMRTKNFLL
jgi:hypothetical protein